MRAIGTAEVVAGPRGKRRPLRLKAFWVRRPAAKLPSVILLNGTSSALHARGADPGELARRDRSPGVALASVERVHAHAIYDLEIDSTATPSSALAAQIIAAQETRSGPSAFERLR